MKTPVDPGLKLDEYFAKHRKDKMANQFTLAIRYYNAGLANWLSIIEMY